jgi:hypothetical protein
MECYYVCKTMVTGDEDNYKLNDGAVLPNERNMSHPESFDRTIQDEARLFDDDPEDSSSLNTPADNSMAIQFGEAQSEYQPGVDMQYWGAPSAGMPGTFDHSSDQDHQMSLAGPFQGEPTQAPGFDEPIAEETAHWAGEDLTPGSRDENMVFNASEGEPMINDLPDGPPMDELPDESGKRRRSDDIVSIWKPKIFR